MPSSWVGLTCYGYYVEQCTMIMLSLLTRTSERMFAAPFLCQLGHGHVEGIQSMAKDPNSLQRFASGSADGVVKVRKTRS